MRIGVGFYIPLFPGSSNLGEECTIFARAAQLSRRVTVVPLPSTPRVGFLLYVLHPSLRGGRSTP